MGFSNKNSSFGLSLFSIFNLIAWSWYHIRRCLIWERDNQFILLVCHSYISLQLLSLENYSIA